MENSFKEISVNRISLPCHTCDGDCCGASTPFTDGEIKEIKKKYPRKFKNLKKIKVAVYSNVLVKKGQQLNINNKCIFYNKGCTIYDVRPKICRDFGDKKYAPCPFNGLDKMPECKKEQSKLTFISQEKGFRFMQGQIQLADSVNSLSQNNDD